MNVTTQYGLLGAKLAHSHSPMLHGMLARYPYELFEVEAQALPSFLRRQTLGGLNVTIPYKQAVLPYCDALSPQARRIGSVNTLVYDAQRRITGHNTDYAGFRQMAVRAGVSFCGRKAVVLGSGGTARTVCAVAADEGAREIVVVSRSGPIRYEDLPLHTDAEILINTTPVGMYPDVAQAPLDIRPFARLEACLDVIYNPLRTRLLLEAADVGVPITAGGLAMLAYQAAESAALFLGHPLAEGLAEQALGTLAAAVENIVLIGMPGCGKTSIGRALAALSGRPFVDIDAEIIRQSGLDIPQIFAQLGEAGFRALESAAVAKAAKRTGIIIATGGGSILDPASRLALRQSGRIAHICRPLHALAQQGRPLSMGADALQKMAAVRMPLYAGMCDIAVDNTQTIEAAADKIWKGWRI